jgi:rhodanese-related sulfurtransferase
MRTLLASALALSLVGSFAGCSKSSKDTDEAAIEAKVPTVTVDELDTSLAKREAQPVDANGNGTRRKMGVIPGAVLLTDSDDFKPSELPTDKTKPLVFYCANTSCGASHHAAAKAITAGYTNVKVLPEGIAGWVKAGKKTQSI